MGVCVCVLMLFSRNDNMANNDYFVYQNVQNFLIWPESYLDRKTIRIELRLMPRKMMIDNKSF